MGQDEKLAVAHGEKLKDQILINQLKAANCDLDAQIRNLNTHVNSQAAHNNISDHQLASIEEDFGRKMAAKDKDMAALVRDNEDLKHQLEKCKTFEPLVVDRNHQLETLQRENVRLAKNLEECTKANTDLKEKITGGKD